MSDNNLSASNNIHPVTGQVINGHESELEQELANTTTVATETIENLEDIVTTGGETESASSVVATVRGRNSRYSFNSAKANTVNVNAGDESIVDPEFEQVATVRGANSRYSFNSAKANTVNVNAGDESIVDPEFEQVATVRGANSRYSFNSAKANTVNVNAGNDAAVDPEANQVATVRGPNSRYSFNSDKAFTVDVNAGAGTGDAETTQVATVRGPNSRYSFNSDKAFTVDVNAGGGTTDPEATQVATVRGANTRYSFNNAKAHTVDVHNTGSQTDAPEATQVSTVRGANSRYSFNNAKAHTVDVHNTGAQTGDASTVSTSRGGNRRYSYNNDRGNTLNVNQNSNPDQTGSGQTVVDNQANDPVVNQAAGENLFAEFLQISAGDANGNIDFARFLEISSAHNAAPEQAQEVTASNPAPAAAQVAASTDEALTPFAEFLQYSEQVKSGEREVDLAEFLAISAKFGQEAEAAPAAEPVTVTLPAVAAAREAARRADEALTPFAEFLQYSQQLQSGEKEVDLTEFLAISAKFENQEAPVAAAAAPAQQSLPAVTAAREAARRANEALTPFAEFLEYSKQVQSGERPVDLQEFLAISAKFSENQA